MMDNEELTKEDEDFMKALTNYFSGYELPRGHYMYVIEFVHSPKDESFTYFNMKLIEANCCNEHNEKLN